MRYQKAISVILCLCLLLSLSCGTAFADTTKEFKALSNTEQVIYGYTEPADVYIRLTNTLDADVSITSITSTNEEDFTADLERGFTVSSGSYYDYPVILKTGKDPGEYEAGYTFTDANGATYQATAKAVVNEAVTMRQEKATSTIWDYEIQPIVKVIIENHTKGDVTLVKAECSSADFEIGDISAEKDHINIASLKSAAYEVKLVLGKDAGTYPATLTFTDSDGKTWTQEISAEVVKRELSVPTVTGKYTYNGRSQALMLENYVAKYMRLTLDYTTPDWADTVSAKNAGHYAPVVDLRDKKNTVWAGSKTTNMQTLSWDIAKYPLAKPVAAEKEYTYSKEEQEFLFEKYVEDGTSALFEGTEILSLVGAKKTNAGTTNVTVSILDKGNFEWADGTQDDQIYTWKMMKKQVEEPRTTKTNYDYDGTAKSITFAEDSIDEDLMDITGNSRIETGTQTVTVALQDPANYEWTAGNSGDLTFTLAVGVPVYSLPTIVGSYTYDGQTQHPELTGFDDEHMVVTDNSGKNAAAYQVKISLKDKEHATWADTGTSDDRNVSWTIHQAPVTIAAKDKTAKTGDPVPSLSAADYTVTGILVPDSLGFIPGIKYDRTPDMSAPGSYDIVVSGDAASADGNYAVTYKNATLTVGQSEGDVIREINIAFDLPLAGSKNLASAIDNIKVSTTYAGVSFGTSGDNIAVYQQNTNTDLTDTVAESGLEENAKVYLKISVPTNSGKTIAVGTTKVTVNGTALSADEIKTLSAGGIINYTFTVPAYRIHFKAGEGSGSMVTQYGSSIEKYSIPQCGFTAPSGKTFDKWQLEGSATTYTPGEQVQLTGSINLAAVYKQSSFGSGDAGGGGSISGGGGSLPGTGSSAQKPVIESNSNADTVLSADGTKVIITVKDGYELVDVKVNGVSKGAVKELTGLKTGDKVEIITKEADDPTLEEMKAQMAKVNAENFHARSKIVTMKNGKKAIKVTWNTTDEDVEFDGVEIYRSTRRYSSYGKKPIFRTTKDIYYNTAIKAGTRYYYKVRGYVEFEGKKIYTGYSGKAWRTVK